MSAFFDILPQQLKKIFIIIICLLTGIIMFFLCYSSILYTLKVKQVTGMMPALNLPAYLVYMWVPFGFAITGIEYALAFYTNLTMKEVYLSIETEWGYEEETVGMLEGSEKSRHSRDFAQDVQ